VRLKTRLLASSSAVAAAALLSTVAAAPAYAAAPANDTFAGALAVGALPFTTSQDTSEATTDADDAEANQNCGAPVTDASVWYSFTAPASDEAIIVDVSSSSYSAGVLVVTGSPGSFVIQACGPGATAFLTVAGETYHFMIIDDQSDGSGNGGTMVMTVDTAPPPPDVDITVDPRGTVDKAGTATLSGTMSCTGEVQFAFVEVSIVQRVGRGSIDGFGFVETPCDGTDRPWSVQISPFIGGSKFAGGKAASVTFGVACGPVFCGEDFEERTVQLSRRG